MRFARPKHWCFWGPQSSGPAKVYDPQRCFDEPHWPKGSVSKTRGSRKPHRSKFLRKVFKSSTHRALTPARSSPTLESRSSVSYTRAAGRCAAGRAAYGRRQRCAMPSPSALAEAGLPALRGQGGPFSQGRHRGVPRLRLVPRMRPIDPMKSWWNSKHILMPHTSPVGGSSAGVFHPHFEHPICH